MSTNTKRDRYARRAVVALVATIAVLLSACTPGGGQTGSPEPQASARTLVIGATAEPTSLDPTADAAVAGSQVMLYNVYETLVKVDSQGQLRPLLAQAWDVSPDRLTYTFQLNHAAKFSDGTPVTADAVAKNIDRIKTQQVAAKLKTVMSIVAGTNVVDEDTLEVSLSRPSVNWLYEMASTAGIVINPAGFDEATTATAGSGPLTLDRWTPGDSISLTKAPSYWGTPSRFDEVTFRYFKDPNAMNASMLSDQLDIISNLQAPEALAQFSDPSRFTVLEGTTNGEVVMGVNNGGDPTDPNVPAGTGNPALKDVRVRQAITMAIDKKALVNTTWGGHGVVLGSMTVPTDPYYEDLSTLFPYDPDKARALLAEAGATNLTLRLKPAALPYATKAAQFIAAQLQQVGITVQVEELQFPARWRETVYDRADYDLTIVAHVEARDLSSFANPNYYWRYHNPQFDSLVTTADQGTVDEYVSGMKQASELLAQDAAAVWLFALPNLVITKPGITGVPTDAQSLSFDTTTIARA
ncbi:ABC transporter substrate-binding protein [Propioniciclava coleopterorum]|uniref:ABC transporter substrate-binding protein n=1 Tax=Propioniciclava coleopterorum TaxID=2714937 RepID=A0A6G7Y8S5_9ACTN|nr:ABC transporter substrate-binding protein [Propioniciclava coleopterorum]QIK73294.1 ABC transporter substrate-binding protein [Propioniciclava coleopterorum]